MRSSLHDGFSMLPASTSRFIALQALSFLSGIPQHVKIPLCHSNVVDPRLELTQLGWANPLGLSAGMDKDVKAALGLERLGFGCIEIGSITNSPCAGNKGPVMWKNHEQKAIYNRVGLKNPGKDIVLPRLEKWQREAPLSQKIVSIATTPEFARPHTEKSFDPREDLCSTARYLQKAHTDMSVNLSCPNVPAHDMSPASVQALIQSIRDCVPPPQRLFAKISPDIKKENLSGVLSALVSGGADGVILGNTQAISTVHYNKTYRVGISGPTLAKRALEMIDQAVISLKGEPFILISNGGVMTAKDLWLRLTHGAHGAQIYSAFVYQGLNAQKKLLEGVLQQINHHKMEDINELIGSHAEFTAS